ncbi:MAG TPA: HAD family hydrolase [Polyangia bacterium]|jgi:HAD superfamily hydrolase (TIGR01490 family)|nr:HAD family hydrolase [Polyangia bacterium]
MRAAAFFDMDRTLLTVNTATRWLSFMRRRGEISLWKTLQGAAWIAQYKLSILDIETVTALATADMKGSPEAELIEKCRIFYEEEVAPAVAPKARTAIEFHRRQGHVVAILSSSTPYVTEPLARALGIEHVLCTRFHIEGGRFVGTHIKPACYGTGKVHWAEQFADEYGVNLAESWFYTDSYTDLPMLERVGVPRVINPDARLRRHARKRGWATETW